MRLRSGPLLALFVGVALGATRAEAQDSLRVVVHYVAGANVYLGAGSDAKIRQGDTLNVRRAATGEVLSPLLVVSSTPDRSVVAFIGAPYSLTRGDTLAVLIAHTTASQTPPAAVPVARAATPYAPTKQRSRLSTDGSLSLDFDLLHTRTTGLGGDPERSSRTFTTPSVGLRYRVQGLGNGLEFRTTLRATQRSSTGGVVEPATLIQVYEAALVRRGGKTEFQLGRFFDPYEYFSGYWDGLLLHRGTDRFGAGVLAGFEPGRGNAGFQSHSPKVGGFFHLRTSGPGARYRTEMSITSIFPKGAPGAHIIAGWAEALQLRGLLLSNTLQFDREPVTGHWIVGQFLGRASTRVGQAGTIYAGFSIRQPYLDRTLVDVRPYRRDNLNTGFNIWTGNLGLTADISTSRQQGLGAQWSYRASASHRPRGAKALGIGLSTMYWTEQNSHGLLISPSANRHFGTTSADLSYQLYRSEANGATSTSHAFELGARLPLSARTQFTIRARERIGGYLQSSGLTAGLWYGF